MDAGSKQPGLSPAEYLEIERQAERKSEYYHGYLVARTGASENHNTLTANALIALGTQLQGTPCRPWSSDMRVRLSPDVFAYPDVVVVCGEQRWDDAKNDTLLNPTLVIEVLSASTESNDRGEKLRLYTALPSLQDYLLVSQAKVLVEHYQRGAEGTFAYQFYNALDAEITFPALNGTLRLLDLYRDVTFAAAEETG
jgi:Uma2 family endonuclease